MKLVSGICMNMINLVVENGGEVYMAINRLYFYFILVVISHHLLAWGLIIAPIVCLFYQPWYITLVICTFVVRTITSRDLCILTEMEKHLRRKLGFRELQNGFVGHYYSWLFRSK